MNDVRDEENELECLRSIIARLDLTSTVEWNCACQKIRPKSVNCTVELALSLRGCRHEFSLAFNDTTNAPSRCLDSSSAETALEWSSIQHQHNTTQHNTTRYIIQPANRRSVLAKETTVRPRSYATSNSK